MKTIRCLVLVCCALILCAAPVRAADTDPVDTPWQKLYLNIGYFITSMDSGFRLGSGTNGIGVDLDVEDLLGLDTSETAFRIDAGWRFTKNKRHKLQFSWFNIDRSGEKLLNSQVEIPDGEGGTTILGPGQFSTTFNFDIIEFKYEYSFFLDDRADFNIGIGLFVMPIEFGFTGVVDGVGSTDVKEDITAPLPVIGLGFEFAITPKWFVRQQLDLFYLEIGDFEGGIVHNNLALEWLPWKHFGFGLGIEHMKVGVEAKGNDYPGVDFVGNVEFDYFGAQLYIKVFM
jgi:hypothetical protein